MVADGPGACGKPPVRSGIVMNRSALLSIALLAACTGDAGSIAGRDDLIGVPTDISLETPKKIDRIIQVTKPEVDVLWVVDDSCSMSEEQGKLAENFPNFIKFFLDSGLDWHIGLVSTDTEDDAKNGKLQGAGGYRYIDAATPNPVAVFAQASAMGIGGSASERGLLAAQRAISQPTPAIQQANRNFIREDAALHIIVISDEEDQSLPRVGSPEFITFLRNLKDDADTPVTFSSIVGPKPMGCANADTNAVAGSIYINVTNKVGGVFSSICEDDWTPVLEELGLQAAGLRKEYFLSELPVPGSIEVWVEDGDYTLAGIDETLIKPTRPITALCDEAGYSSCFQYRYNPERNSIYITDSVYIPAPDAIVNIEYLLLKGLQDQDALDDLEGREPIDTAAP